MIFRTQIFIHKKFHKIWIDKKVFHPIRRWVRFSWIFWTNWRCVYRLKHFIHWWLVPYYHSFRCHQIDIICTLLHYASWLSHPPIIFLFV
ncbi:hypothetical protein OIU77_014400 [Salix suchowensis]|uniref:Uncharacterized protein n=1 Tax=Salix suchowensis TaxID=1278906 RepID=A0ABQ8ZXG6_9ROSI|nr:hypothetical protein OIU77_014400 [Salix suchowensis]KAJ6356571.1 hypothetical protein OIU78_004627 [Salix suchowensis]